MPPTRRKSTVTSGKIVFQHGTIKSIHRCPPTYEEALALVRDGFGVAENEGIEFLIDASVFEEANDIGLVKLGKASWDLLLECAGITLVIIRTYRPVIPVGRPQAVSPSTATGASPLLERNGDPQSESAGGSLSTSTATLGPRETTSMHVTVWFQDQILKFSVRKGTSVKKLRKYVATQAEVCASSFQLIFDGSRVRDNDTMESIGVEDDDEFVAHVEQVGGKPVIYLWSPRALTANISLSLVPSWKFSHVYPASPIESKREGQRINWTVDVDSNGTLRDTRTNTEVAYLFWEAITSPLRTPSPSPHDTQGISISAFCPTTASVSPLDSILLPIAEVSKYLDNALKAMTLHVEARTDFITYWLPSLEQHKHVALRFLPQVSYEPAAPMVVTPAPDVITRIFMLFRGVSDKDLNEWNRTASVKETKPEDWKDVVGVSSERASNHSLFRVLEWGGMEVKG